MKIKGYVIDPATSLISPVRVEAENVSEYQRLVKAECLDSAAVFNGNRAWVSDTGMLEGLPPFLIANRNFDVVVLWGRALILGDNPPDCVSCKSSIADIARFTARLTALSGSGETAVLTVDQQSPSFDFAELAPVH